MSPSLLRWAEDQLLPEQARVGLTGPGAPFELVDEDVLGATMPVFAQRPRSGRQMLEISAQRLGDQPFLVFPERTFTYRSILEPVAAVAASLSDRFNIGPGDRVAIACPNTAAHAITAWAAVSIGAVVVELNGWWAGPEMEHGIGLTRPKVVFGDRRRLDRLPAGGVGVPVVGFEDDFAGLEAHGAGRRLPPDPVDEDDPLVVLFTSGTTGRPKGAVLSHRAHVQMMMQAALQGMIGAIRSGTTTPPAGPPTTCGVSPMFHVSGFSCAVIGGALTGITIVYPPAGRWDPDVQLALTEQHQISSWPLVPTQLWRLLEHPRIDEYDLSSLRRVAGGGATFQPELWRQVRELLPQVTVMATGYGMTETCGAGTHQDGTAAVEHPDAVGAPVPGYSVCIRDPDGQIVPEGQTGGIHLRGACNFLGYWDDEAATKRALDADRWYHTGELGHIEGGLLYLDGRGAELIIRAGENIYPIEIENRLIEHPAIAEAAVIGEPHRVLGEEVKAVLVRQPGEPQPDLAEVQAWVGQVLAPFKVPTHLEFRDALPHNAAGKVQKTLLRPAGPDGTAPATAACEEE
jgi:acyl-CoA synthetase (AMP-forming)/AMP-acid ligase II